MTATIADEQFSSKWGFVMAAIGGAVGLGNIWRFPFIAGENGGGAFILLYFLFVVSFGVPAVMAMIVIGRRGGKSPVGSTQALALAEGRSGNWKYLGWIALTVAFLALSFFSMVSGWIVVYLLKSVAGQFAGITSMQSLETFAGVKANVGGMILWHGVFMIFTIIIVGRGVRKGVEAAVKLMMPALFLILLVLVAYAAITAEFTRAVEFMFLPDFSKINRQVILLALGQAFFSLSVGGGGIIAYGAYLEKTASIPRVALLIASANVSVDLLAGLAIFPVVFAYGLEAAAGPGLIFETLPIAFGQMPGGRFFGTLFFLLMFFAALSTSISMLESIVARLIERKGTNRPGMAMLAGGLAWLVGLGSVFSFNIWSDFKPLHFIDMLKDATVFRIVDFFTVNVLIMISAFLITVFVGRIMSEQATRDELAFKNESLFRAWRFIMRYPAPVAIACIFLLSFVS
jgi:NSS family neurotransmitter:Na+ symporter